MLDENVVVPKIGTPVVVSFHDAEHKVFTTVAHILAITGLAGGLNTSEGHPALTVAYPDPKATERVLGSPKPFDGYVRRTGVVHHSHPDNAAGKVGIVWGHALDTQDAQTMSLLKEPTHSAHNKALDRTEPGAEPKRNEPRGEQLLRSETEQQDTQEATKPSSADLDAIAAEEATKEATTS